MGRLALLLKFMMTKRTLICPWLQDYANRDYQWHNLSADAFATLNEMGPLALSVVSGCIDALDTLPSGGSQAYGRDHTLFGPGTISRGRSASEIADREALARRLLDELHLKEAAPRPSKPPKRRAP